MESTRQNNNINAINNVRMLINELRNNYSREETKRIRDKLYKKEVIYNFLRKKDNLTNKEKKVLKNNDGYLENISMHLKNLKKHFKKLQKYQYGIDYLFNEHSEEDYASIDAINDFKDARKFLNKRRSNLSRKETNEIRKKAAYNFLKEKEQNGSLTNSEKKVLKKIDKYLKNFKNDFDKLQKYQYNITHGLDYLFKELDEEDYYKPTEVKSALMVAMCYMKVKEMKIITYQ